MCGVGKAERAERLGLSVMLSFSETSQYSKRYQKRDPSLTLRMTASYFLCSDDKESNK